MASVRPGHLSNPPSLPQALEATGFRFSSSVTAGNALSHLPIRLTYGRGAEAETGIFEFPLAVEDERAPLMGLRLQQSLDVARKISRDGGIYPVLVHPNILGHKLDFVRGFTKALQSSAWFGSVEDFGSWWAARDDVDLDVSRDGDTVTVQLATRSAVHDLTIEIPSHWSLQKPNVAALELKERPGAVTIGTLQGNATLSFRPSLRAKASL